MFMSKNDSSSDHSCTSSNEIIMSGKSHEETFKSIEKRVSGGRRDHHDESWPSNLIMRAPSLPPHCMEIKDDDQSPATKGIDDDHGRRRRLLRNNTNISTKNNNLLSEEIQDDDESEFSMGKLIRQASLSNSDTFPPRRHATYKGVTATSSSLSRHGSIMKMELGKLEGSDKIRRPQRVMNQLKTQKSLNDLELYRELQGFKDLGLGSESCQAQTSTRPVDKKSTDDMKAQIKFWARAVASNVRHES